MLLKDNVALKNAQTRFEALTGITFDWAKFEETAVKEEVALGSGNGWMTAYIKALPTLIDQVIETAVENEGAVKTSLFDTMLYFNDVVMSECYKHWLEDDANVYIRENNIPKDARSRLVDNLYNGTLDLRQDTLGLVDYSGPEEFQISGVGQYLYFTLDRIQKATTKAQLCEQKYQTGQLSIENMLQFARKKNPAKGQSLGQKDAQTLAAYAKALENTNKNRSWLSWLVSLPTHFKEKRAIKEMRAIAAKCETPLADLENEAGREIPYVRQQIETYQGKLNKVAGELEKQNQITQLREEERKAGDIANRDRKNQEKAEAYQTAMNQRSQAEHEYRNEYGREFVSLVETRLFISDNLSYDNEPLMSDRNTPDNIISEKEINEDLHKQLQVDTCGKLHESVSRIESPVNDVPHKDTSRNK